jgi:hypothetical protein
MNAIYLHRPDGTPTKWSMCQECKTVAAPGNYDLSEKCCTCYDCGLPLPKDERIPYAEGKGKALYHRKCEEERSAKREAEQLEKAELIPDYTGPVHCDGVRGGWGEGYFPDVNELAETLDNEEDQSSRPEFVFCCTEVPFRRIDLDWVIENCSQDMDEDAAERLEGLGDLEKALIAFYEANKESGSWMEDRKHKVAVPPAVVQAGK